MKCSSPADNIHTAAAEHINYFPTDNKSAETNSLEASHLWRPGMGTINNSWHQQSIFRLKLHTSDICHDAANVPTRHPDRYWWDTDLRIVLSMSLSIRGKPEEFPPTFQTVDERVTAPRGDALDAIWSLVDFQILSAFNNNSSFHCPSNLSH